MSGKLGMESQDGVPAELWDELDRMYLRIVGDSAKACWRGKSGREKMLALMLAVDALHFMVTSLQLEYLALHGASLDAAHFKDVEHFERTVAQFTKMGARKRLPLVDPEWTAAIEKLRNFGQVVDGYDQKETMQVYDDRNKREVENILVDTALFNRYQSCLVPLQLWKCGEKKSEQNIQEPNMEEKTNFIAETFKLYDDLIQLINNVLNHY